MKSHQTIAVIQKKPRKSRSKSKSKKGRGNLASNEEFAVVVRKKTNRRKTPKSKTRRKKASKVSNVSNVSNTKSKGKGKGKGKGFSKGKYHNTVLCKYDQSGTCMYGDKCCYAHGEHQLMKKQNAKIGQLPKAWLRDDEIENMKSRGVNPNLRTDRPVPPMSLEQGRIEARRAMQKHVQEQSAPLPPGNTEEDRATPTKASCGMTGRSCSGF